MHLACRNCCRDHSRSQLLKMAGQHSLHLYRACVLRRRGTHSTVSTGRQRPLALDAPDTVFSEARAMAHTFHLASTIGDRQARHRPITNWGHDDVSMPVLRMGMAALYSVPTVAGQHVAGQSAWAWAISISTWFHVLLGRSL